MGLVEEKVGSPETSVDRPSTWLLSDQSRPWYRPGSRALWLTAGWTLTLALLIFVGPLLVESHFVLLGRLIVSLGVLLLAGLALTHWNADHFHACLNSEDRRLLAEGSEDHFPVQIEITQDNFVTGRDRGVIWREDGRLVFHGHRSSFVLRPQDVTAAQVRLRRSYKGDSHVTGMAGCLRIKHRDRKVEVVIAPLVEPERGFIAPLRAAFAVLRETGFLSPMLKPLHLPTTRLVEEITEFEKGDSVPGEAQLPPLELDPRLHWKPTETRVLRELVRYIPFLLIFAVRHVGVGYLLLIPVLVYATELIVRTYGWHRLRKKLASVGTVPTG